MTVSEASTATLTEPIDRALNMHHASLDGGQGVCHGQVPVVVAVNPQRGRHQKGDEDEQCEPHVADEIHTEAERHAQGPGDCVRPKLPARVGNLYSLYAQHLLGKTPHLHLLPPASG